MPISDWDALAARMDGLVDQKLGDRISYSTDGGATFPVIAGFVIFNNEPLSFPLQTDELLGSILRLKVNKSLLAYPDPAHRIRHELLTDRYGAATFQPAGTDPEEQGRYWLFDIQKV